MTTTTIIAAALAAGTVFTSSSMARQSVPLFTVQERHVGPSFRPNPRCAREPYDVPITYSQVSVFESREVVFRVSSLAPCQGEVGDPPFGSRWEGPPATEVVTRATLSTAEFQQLKIFLDRPKVRAVQDFMNAGPGVGDFKIAIARSGGMQTIEVISLSPNHYQLVRDPELIQVICRAKELARAASPAVTLAAWCNATPKA